MVEIRATGSNDWNCNTRRWQLETIWHKEERLLDVILWEVHWVLKDSGHILGINNLFWKNSKVSVLYLDENKTLPQLKVWRGKVVRVLHKRSAVDLWGTKMILMTNIIEDEIPIKLNIW